MWLQVGDDDGAGLEVGDFLHRRRLHAQQHVGLGQRSGAIGHHFGIGKRRIRKVGGCGGGFLDDDLGAPRLEFLCDFRGQRNAALALGRFAQYGNDDRHGSPST